ncbi:cupin domain-containing protein [Pseudonocardia cypriaca]|uniref:Cupin domain n=1 Tax=Pseudonocardia cypriaca TaxID=882449 RepID=A0A543FY42_9PSEU|nr:cupin domain-containing protein [Pseudonocardia cypriaca]TQM38737.1 cupin domain [Pseudonocardia cypriaca]
METDDPRSWPLLTNVEGLPLLGGHGHVRIRLRENHGVLFEIFYPAGVASPEHRHAHDSFVHLLSGRLIGTAGGEPAQLEPGECLAHPEGVLHTVEAVVDSRWLEFKSPPQAGWR